MRPIQPSRLCSAEEELAPIGVGPCVGHTQHPGSSVHKLKVLVLELVAVDALPPRTVVVSEVPALAHEVRYDAVEATLLEPETLGVGAESEEVGSSLGDDVLFKLHHHARETTLVSDGHVEVHLGVLEGGLELGQLPLFSRCKAWHVVVQPSILHIATLAAHTPPHPHLLIDLERGLV